jgi:hypothetical protein
MGLKISSIARLPIATDRDYFIYFLDYGWDEPLSRALYDNFERMAAFASENRLLVIAGLSRQEFANEVLSWHRINGEDAENLLPAIMIADCDPHTLAQTNEGGFHRSGRKEDRPKPERFLIIPLKQVCKTPTDVTDLLTRITADIRKKKKLSDFTVEATIDRSGEGLAEMIVLKPSIGGVGIDLKKAYELGSKYYQSFKKSRDRK